VSIRKERVVVLALLTALCGGGCSYSLSLQQQEPPPATVSTVVIGPVVADDADHQREVRRFRRVLADALRDAGGFDNVIAMTPAAVPSEAVLVTGHIHRIGDGSETLRFTVGYGAGAPRLRVRLAIYDGNGVRLAAFAQQARSFDGTGYSAHWDPVYLDDLVDELAQRSAVAIVRWREGRSIEGDFWEDWF
jgi:hypothetical protein